MGSQEWKGEYASSHPNGCHGKAKILAFAAEKAMLLPSPCRAIVVSSSACYLPSLCSSWGSPFTMCKLPKVPWCGMWLFPLGPEYLPRGAAPCPIHSGAARAGEACVITLHPNLPHLLPRLRSMEGIPSPPPRIPRVSLLPLLLEYLLLALPFIPLPILRLVLRCLLSAIFQDRSAAKEFSFHR